MTTSTLTSTKTGNYQPSLWAEYRNEREGHETLEWEDGFVCYSYPEEGVCYIVDIYVRESVRGSLYAVKIADEVVATAKLKGCHTLFGSVDPRAKGATHSMQALIKYGMKLSHIDEPLIYLSKEI